MNSWECQNSCYSMYGGRDLRYCCPSIPVPMVREKTTARYWQAFCGCSRLPPAGAICPLNLTLARPIVGADFSLGMSETSGLTSGGIFSPSWTNVANSIGARVSSAIVLLPPKRRHVHWQNQARQWHEVDGGGRRARYSFGKQLGPRLACGSYPDRKNLGPSARATRRGWPPQKQTTTPHRRSPRRHRSAPKAVARARHRVDLSASQKPPQSPDAGLTRSVELSSSVESRTHVSVTGEFPSTLGAHV